MTADPNSKPLRARLIKTITLTQPWASLIAYSAKRIETRGWKTSYRGPLAIHAAKGFPGTARAFCESNLVCRAFGWPECGERLTQEWLDDNAQRIKSLPLGLLKFALARCAPLALIRTHARRWMRHHEKQK